MEAWPATKPVCGSINEMAVIGFHESGSGVISDQVLPLSLVFINASLAFFNPPAKPLFMSVKNKSWS